MDWLTYLSWVAGPALQVTLVIFMVRRKLQVTFPRFFSYILFQILKSAVLFVASRYFEESYFDVYWAGNAISVLLAVTVMDEVLQKLFKQYGGIQTVATAIFRWACGLLLLVAILGAVTSNDGSADRVFAAIMTFNRSVRLMQCGLFLLVMLLCRLFRLSWRQPAFGIALGFGVFASIELIALTVATSFSDTSGAIVSLIISFAYNAVTILWISYLQQQREAVPEVPVARPVSTMSLVLATPAATTEEGYTSFLTMVEEAVDRVLSRQSWPSPPDSASQVVASKPGNEKE